MRGLNPSLTNMGGSAVVPREHQQRGPLEDHREPTEQRADSAAVDSPSRDGWLEVKASGFGTRRSRCCGTRRAARLGAELEGEVDSRLPRPAPNRLPVLHARYHRIGTGSVFVDRIP